MVGDIFGTVAFGLIALVINISTLHNAIKYKNIFKRVDGISVLALITVNFIIGLFILGLWLLWKSLFY